MQLASPKHIYDPSNIIIIFCYYFHLIVSDFLHGNPQLLQGYKTRDNAIKGCITEVSERIKTLQQQRDRDPDDIELIKNIRKHQTRVRVSKWDGGTSLYFIM